MSRLRSIQSCLRHGAPVSVLAVSALTGCTASYDYSSASTQNLERLSYSTTQNLSISYLHSGDDTSPRVIYVHGTPGSAADYAAFLSDPIAGFEHVAIDRPGFGSSLPYKTLVSFQAQAQALEPLLVKKNGRWPILVGHSLGGPIVARAAAVYPDRISGIVIVAGSLSPALEKPRWFNHLGALPGAGLLLPQALEHSNQEIMAAPEQTQLLQAVLSNIRCPVAIIHGDRDQLVPVANVDYMRQHLAHVPALKVDVLTGENHFIPWQRPESIRNAITWISQLDSSVEPSDSDQE